MATLLGPPMSQCLLKFETERPAQNQAGRLSQRPLYRLHAVTLDNVADLHILIILECHAAFLPGHDLARIVLESLELPQLALMHDDAVADQPNVGAALHSAVGNAAAGNIADFRHLENFENDGIAEH